MSLHIRLDAFWFLHFLLAALQAAFSYKTTPFYLEIKRHDEVIAQGRSRDEISSDRYSRLTTNNFIISAQIPYRPHDY
ncbi:uncharacterized protein RSE6_12880 [Rhynchosporium secalis]|uniref:Secreted protein n=1 Tax=Rhynchosporium secalis TaxID=38038 RepID=A0A1E1MRH2_RHYSE|nr:uncharacterized protein RSE6_12880 [Rhynchosporium secalis]